MKLYYAPGTCALSPHIALLEAGLKFDLEKVDIRTKQYAGGDFRRINSKGSVPVLELNNGEKLTEGPAILQYIADQKPEANLIPKAGTWERYRVQEWLNFITSDLHKTFGILFAADRWVASKEGNGQLKASVKEGLAARFNFVNEKLEGKTYLMGEHVSVPDFYLYTVLRWAPAFEIDLTRWPQITKFVETMNARPKVKEALESQGLK